VVVGAACAGRPLPSSTTAPEPVRALGAADAERFAELLAMADARRVDSAVIEDALTRGSTPVRVEAVLAIGQVQGRAFVPRLRDAVRGRDTAVAATAAFALGRIGDTTAATILVLGDAVDDASGADATVGCAAAWALGAIGAPARNAIVHGLAPRVAATQPAAAGVLAATLYAASTLRPVPADAVLPFVASGDAVVARAAAYALGRGRDPAGARALLGAALSRDPDTRSYAARGLAVRAAGDSLADTAVAALRRLVADSDAHVRIAAVQSAASYGAAAREMLLTALADSDANVRIAAGAALEPVLGRARADWVRAFGADTSLAYRRGIVAAAVRAGIVLEAIANDNDDRWQRRQDWRYRAAAADAAAGTSVERMRDLALPLTRDPDGRVRTAAYAAFAPTVDTQSIRVHPWRRQFMALGLTDADFYVRATALGALQRGASAADGPAFLRSYALAAQDRQDDARVAAIALLVSAWSRDSAAFTPTLRDAVAALPPPSDPVELGVARGSTLFARWPASAPPPHDAAWYRGIVDSVVRPALAGHPARAIIDAARGPITVELFGVDAPITVANFIALARTGFYRETTFHRVVPAFVAQDGDPRGDGNGGPPYAIRDELNRDGYARGTLGMALSGPDTGGSQYFLTLTPQPQLDGSYTVFGRVVDGFAALDGTVANDSIADVRIP
jgi:cyclophilin family peptidyl-prolyl cis-trans isomerase/HEAT repeat protein